MAFVGQSGTRPPLCQRTPLCMERARLFEMTDRPEVSPLEATRSATDQPGAATQPEPGLRQGVDLDWREAAPQGFGDRHNSWPWSMIWWKGKLFVGTNRAWHCAERASFNSALPVLFKYPPKDPGAECAPDPTDLPLQAEIWCWTPETDSWERLYQSPKDVPIVKSQGKTTAREVGYRYMTVFTEPDGTEALYVSGVSTRFIFRPSLPTRILRSVDGRTFTPLPQDPGTFLGNVEGGSFRTLVTYKNRLYVHIGTVAGEGVLLESSDPARGNDSFRQVSPKEMRVFEMLPYNGYLYVGLRDPKKGYSVLRTDATGAPPYRFTTVVEPGAFAANPSYSVISMFVFRGRLYVGTDRPGEVIRINPDDSWDLVCGAPRETPMGWKYPISGLDTGFGNWLNAHIWRMQVHQDRLYIGTWNMATDFRLIAGADDFLGPNYGFDLFETSDGWHYIPVTTDGFGDRFSNGVRSFASTPHGLFLGAANKWEGLRIWRGVRKGDEQEPARSRAADDSGLAPSDMPATEVRPAAAPGAPVRLEGELTDQGFVLSWEESANAETYRIYRARIDNIRDQVMSNSFMTRLLRIVRSVLFFRPDIYFPRMPDELWVPGAYGEVGSSNQPVWVDAGQEPGVRYLYRVRAEGVGGKLSTTSNIIAAPLHGPVVTVASLTTLLKDRGAGGKFTAAALIDLATECLARVRENIDAQDLPGASAQLQRLSSQLAPDSPDQPDWPYVDDLKVLVAKLQRRVALCQAGVVSRHSLIN